MLTTIKVSVCLPSTSNYLPIVSEDSIFCQNGETYEIVDGSLDLDEYHDWCDEDVISGRLYFEIYAPLNSVEFEYSGAGLIQDDHIQYEVHEVTLTSVNVPGLMIGHYDVDHIDNEDVIAKIIKMLEAKQ